MEKKAFFEDSLNEAFGKDSDEIYEKSPLLRYLAIKTQSVEKSSKSRANLGNLYAIYVLTEHYIKNGSGNKAKFSNLFRRQRELPSGSKLQNHALNHRCNLEFAKFFPDSKGHPIIRNQTTKEYWINETLLNIKVNSKDYNIAEAVISIIEKYIKMKEERFSNFLSECLFLKSDFDEEKFKDFLRSQLLPNVDARIFEIVSFVILKSHYELDNLTLYKTGRTNANDGGIDFVLKPQGRFFQVSEVLDFKKYFLDIDKINRYPLTFVIKSEKNPKELIKMIEEKAKQNYDSQTLKKYMEAIEEIISIETLNKYLEESIEEKKSDSILDDLIIYYKLEFNIK